MEYKQEVYPNNSNIELIKIKQKKVKVQGSYSLITIRDSSINVIIHGNRNRIKVQDSAGRITIQGNQNNIQIRRCWMACQLQGNGNIFGLNNSEFQLQKHQGIGNFIPGVIGEHPVHWANRLLLQQERNANMRQNLLKQSSKTIKKYWSNLIKSQYGSSQTRECPICYDDIKAGDEVTSIFCFHFFHSACIQACLQTTTKCPVCSLDLLQFIKQRISSGNYICKQNQLLMKESMQDQNH